MTSSFRFRIIKLNVGVVRRRKNTSASVDLGELTNSSLFPRCARSQKTSCSQRHLGLEFSALLRQVPTDTCEGEAPHRKPLLFRAAAFDTRSATSAPISSPWLPSSHKCAKCVSSSSPRRDPLNGRIYYINNRRRMPYLPTTHRVSVVLTIREVESLKWIFLLASPPPMFIWDVDRRAAAHLMKLILEEEPSLGLCSKWFYDDTSVFSFEENWRRGRELVESCGIWKDQGTGVMSDGNRMWQAVSKRASDSPGDRGYLGSKGEIMKVFKLESKNRKREIYSERNFRLTLIWKCPDPAARPRQFAKLTDKSKLKKCHGFTENLDLEMLKYEYVSEEIRNWKGTHTRDLLRTHSIPIHVGKSPLRLGLEKLMRWHVDWGGLIRRRRNDIGTDDTLTPRWEEKSSERWS